MTPQMVANLAYDVERRDGLVEKSHWWMHKSCPPSPGRSPPSPERL
ncbi:unnamed protein product [Arabidopsis thaliana]|uniref:(thale cress) hypothetical protein n=1 Tax=Arabidopsis thaliana TaxID=3702 RepID=A0A7G2E8M5_ARATH|nr:unnamed protein product [Arabidopsis thaliana]